MGKKKKVKKLKVREGSRLKLKEGLFAMVRRTPKPHETTVLVKVYGSLNPVSIREIPMGHIDQIVRY